MSKTNEEYKNLSIKEFSKAANKYESDHAGVYEICKKDYPDILKEIEKEDFDSLLDVGCGPAPMLELLSNQYPTKKFTGIDLTPAMIEVGRKKNLKNVELIIGDGENLPFKENSFDVIICSMSAHHYPNINSFYKSTYRCLKPNGRLIIRDMTTDNKLLAFLVKYVEMPLANLLGHGDVCMLERDQVQSGLENAGYKVVINEIRKPLRLHIVARKPAK